MVILLLAAVLVGVDVGRRVWNAQHAPDPGTPVPAAAPQPLDSAPPGGAGGQSPNVKSAPLPGAGATPPPADQAAGPREGSGVFAFAGGSSPVFGAAGNLRRFEVAVEEGTGQGAEDFGKVVDAILGDSRSWIGSGQLRLQRVPNGAPSEFTVMLATPATSQRLCAEGGLQTNGFTSCRLTGRVIINLARWLTAIPNYGAPLDVYRAYALNHEVGHELGQGHEACPGPGRPAPVMQQQTFGLKGCVANPWPYPKGKLYSGPKVP